MHFGLRPCHANMQCRICQKRSGGFECKQLWVPVGARSTAVKGIFPFRAEFTTGGGANLNFSRPVVDPPSRQLVPTLPLCRSFTLFTPNFTPFSFHYFTQTSVISPMSKPTGQKPNPPTSFLQGEVGGSSFFGSIFWGVKTRSGGVEPPPNPPGKSDPAHN